MLYGNHGGITPCRSYCVCGSPVATILTGPGNQLIAAHQVSRANWDEPINGFLGSCRALRLAAIDKWLLAVGLTGCLARLSWPSWVPNSINFHCAACAASLHYDSLQASGLKRFFSRGLSRCRSQQHVWSGPSPAPCTHSALVRVVCH